MKLTKRLIDATKPGAKEIWIWDSVLPSFGLRVQPTGTKTFVVRYRTASNTQRKLTIGRADTFDDVDVARDQAREALAKARDGGDPAKDKTDKRKSATVKDLSERHTTLLSVKVKPSTQKNYEILWRLHILPKLGSLRVADVTTADIFERHAEMGETPINANRALEVMMKAFTLAERLGWRPKGSNPCADVQAYPENERQRILTGDEIARLFAALDKLQSETPTKIHLCNLIRLLLLSGLRVSEWSCAEWSWYSDNMGTLYLPDSKTGSRVVHLSDAVCQLLRAMKKSGHERWIIPNYDATAPLRYPHQQWDTIRKALGLNEVRLHDLRHTVGSLGHMNGLSQREVADMLGHKQMKTTERYLHTYDVRKREAANKASDYILNLGK